MVTSPGSGGKKTRLRIDQVNVFYNYAIGFEATSVDLVGTAGKLLKKGIAKAVFFSDLKFLYTDADGEVQIDWMQPQGRQWDSSWKINFDSKVPADVAAEIIQAIEVSFHEHRIEGLTRGKFRPTSGLAFRRSCWNRMNCSCLFSRQSNCSLTESPS